MPIGVQPSPTTLQRSHVVEYDVGFPLQVPLETTFRVWPATALPPTTGGALFVGAVDTGGAFVRSARTFRMNCCTRGSPVSGGPGYGSRPATKLSEPVLKTLAPDGAV